MFTGIVEEMGEVIAVEDLGQSSALVVRARKIADDLEHGASIAVNGVCLTVTTWEPDADGTAISFDVMGETLKRSSLGELAAGKAVNLERAATMQTRLGGHIVQGHVDGTGAVLGREPSEHWEVVTISLPSELARYVVEKGSITVDGVSLTVSGIDDTTFQVSLIPTTLAETTLGAAVPGTTVNLEVDIIAKHLEKLVAK
jgi:riboflavin synthase